MTVRLNLMLIQDLWLRRGRAPRVVKTEVHVVVELGVVTGHFHQGTIYPLFRMHVTFMPRT